MSDDTRFVQSSDPPASAETLAVPPVKPLPHPRALAFLGDAVFELFLRKQAVRLGFSQSKDLHAFSTSHANAAAQVRLFHSLEGELTEQEREWARQGRNVGVGGARKAAQADHRIASALEAVLGALYLQDSNRLASLLEKAATFLCTETNPTEALPLLTADSALPDSHSSEDTV